MNCHECGVHPKAITLLCSHCIIERYGEDTYNRLISRGQLGERVKGIGLKYVVLSMVGWTDNRFRCMIAMQLCIPKAKVTNEMVSLKRKMQLIKYENTYQNRRYNK